MHINIAVSFRKVNYPPMVFFYFEISHFVPTKRILRENGSCSQIWEFYGMTYLYRVIGHFKLYQILRIPSFLPTSGEGLWTLHFRKRNKWHYTKTRLTT